MTKADPHSSENTLFGKVPVNNSLRFSSHRIESVVKARKGLADSSKVLLYEVASASSSLKLRLYSSDRQEHNDSSLSEPTGTKSKPPGIIGLIGLVVVARQLEVACFAGEINSSGPQRVSS